MREDDCTCNSRIWVDSFKAWRGEEGLQAKVIYGWPKMGDKPLYDYPRGESDVRVCDPGEDW